MRFWLVIFSAAMISMMVRGVHADIPKIISYQGKVTDTGGVSVADGSYTMRFRIYNDSSAGTMEWDSGDVSVDVGGSVFSVLLGESPQPSLGLSFDEAYWLDVIFEGVAQSPRQQLASVGYAYMASGLVAGTEVVGSVNSGTNAAIKGTNTAMAGVAYGIYGRSDSTFGFGVWGYASATTGDTYGVYGHSLSTQGRGVYGRATATTGYTYGVCGLSESTSGRGAYGAAWATTGSNCGVYGISYSSEGRGVRGIVNAHSGSTFGVHGQNSSTSGRGVYGEAIASTGTTYGVHGYSASTDGYGVYYSGGLAGTGTKSCVVKTSQGPSLMYCQESPENWFEDFGEGQLVNGRAHIELDQLFLETVTIDESNPMKVFVEHRGRCSGTYIETGLTGFDVVEQDEGTSNVGFCYRVVAKRKGFEDRRFDYCKAAETDSYLYPELREKEIREHEEERAQMEEERTLMEADRAHREEG